jgi:allantoinase
VLTPEGVRPASVHLENGSVLSVEDYGLAPSRENLLDVGDDIVMPGLIDTHVHINEPGRTEWEGFQTATRAAAAGGVTCVVDMPLNSIPAVTTVESLAQKRAAAPGNCTVDYGFWAGVVPGNQNDLLPFALAGALGYKCFLSDTGVPEFTMVSESDLRSALPIVAATGLPLLVHAESPTILDAVDKHARNRTDVPSRSYRAHLESRPDDAELQAVELLIRLCREFNCQIHIVHLATAQALDSLRAARTEGLPITAETCPHYLHFTAERIPDGATEYKCAPPIRGAANRERLWQALEQGTISLVASDHSPCLPELRKKDAGDFRSAWGGIASLSLGLPVIWTEASQRGLSIADVSRWMAEKPAWLAGLQNRKGRIARGYDADLVIFDPGSHFTVTTDRLHFRHPVSPYLNESLTGEVKQTYVRGQLVFDNGSFPGKPIGEEVALVN